MRLIDADVLKNKILQLTASDWSHAMWVPKALNEFIDFIYGSPTVDPIKHGHWIDTGSGQECSVCGEIQYGYNSYKNYCSNCGAKMDEEREEE